MGKILHLKSKDTNAAAGGVVTPKLPDSSVMDYGEIAVNYADGYETLSIKNSADKVVSFSSTDHLIKYADSLVGEESALAKRVKALEDKLVGLDEALKKIVGKGD